jgi:hypothetical protein
LGDVVRQRLVDQLDDRRRSIGDHHGERARRLACGCDQNLTGALSIVHGLAGE